MRKPGSVNCANAPVTSTGTSLPSVSGVRKGVATATAVPMSTAHMSIWVIATSPTPAILPSMSWKGLTDDTTISSTRLFFSSMIEVMTIWP